MDRNLLLAFALSFLVLSTWTVFQQKQRATAPPREEVAEAQPQVEEQGAVDGPERFGDLPSAEAALPPAAREPLEELPRGERISIDQPLYRAELDARGAAISRWELVEYTDRYGDPIVLVDPVAGSSGAAATPLLELGLGDLSRALWEVEWREPETAAFLIEKEGVRVRKTYQFDRDSYVFRLLIEIDNESGASVEPRFLLDWPAREREGYDFREQALAVLHEGDVESKMLGGLGSAGFFGSMFGKKPQMEYEPYEGDVDWAGVQTPYFLNAAFPDQPTRANARFVVLDPSKAAAVELFFDPVQVPSGQSVAREFRAYLGPKEEGRLEAMGGGAVESIDLGWFWVEPLTHLFLRLLRVLYSIVPNYGVAIIILTILVRVVTAPLTIKQMRSMERMRRLQPRIKEIQAKFAEDRQKQSEEMMRLYKQEKVNPLGGCFPMLLQFPVFIGLYWALRSSIQLRHAPFFGWIEDLSAPETLFELPGIGLPVRVLPLVMGASMVLQQKITPMQADPAQARMMMTIMPVMMTVIFYQFPSGLVLYWMMSNFLAIGHQLWIGRKMGDAGKPRETKAKQKSDE